MTDEKWALLLRKIARGLMLDSKEYGLNLGDNGLMPLFTTDDDEFDDWLCGVLAEYYDYE